MEWLKTFLFSSQLPLLGLNVPPSHPVDHRCVASSIPYPNVFGTEILSLSAAPVTNYSLALPQADQHFALDLTGLDFCNVTVQYTHPKQGDSINVHVWLPFGQWNGRFMGTGGGGYATESGPMSLSYAVSQGYSAVATDGGHASDSPFSASSWALSSPGNVDWVLLQDFAAVALDDAASIGKAVTTSFYGTAPKYSYWSGCSTGGRQGLMMAQRYPTQYDGIMAAAPAINWASFVVASYWAQLVMNQLGYYPPQSELAALTAAATAACDDLDGVSDGIIAAPGLCDFDPHSVVGKTYECSERGTNMTITSEAATIALAAWTGPRSVDGKLEWYGLNKDASLLGLANTDCSTTGKCTGVPFSISTDWISLFVQKDPNFDVTKMSYRDFDSIFRQSVNQYTSIISTNDPDLTDFRDAGGKMITWHGLADQAIFPNGTYDYYDKVLALDPKAADYYRFFPAPGVAHCAGGPGWYPSTALQSLVDWVEKGQVPETLDGTTLPDIDGVVRHAPLCPYPLVTAYQAGHVNDASSFECQRSF